MGSRYQTSTGAIMLLIVVVAVEMVMFQGVWEIVLFPSITMIFLAFNLGLYFLLVRPRSMETRIIGMIWGGVAAFFGVAGYLLTVDSSRGPGGFLGRIVEDFLKNWAMSLSAQAGALAMILRFVTARIVWLEFAVLDLLGLTLIGAGGWLQNRLHDRRVRARAAGQTGLAPLDDRAATPV